MHGSKTDRKTDAHPRGAREGRGLPDAFRAASVFHTGHHDAFDEVPLTEEIEHDAGHEGHAGAAHDGGPVRLQGALELAQACLLYTSAAAAAQRGDMAGAQAMLKPLLDDPQAAALLEKLKQGR